MGRSADAGFAIAAVALGFALFHAAWAHPATSLIGVSEDPVQNVWLLGLTPHALANAMPPWTTTLIDAPSGVNLLWNPLMPLVGLLLWPVTSTAGPVVAYNLLATLTPALSAAAAYVALRYLVHDRVASWIGALMFGFSPYVVGQLLGHPHAALGVTPPLLLIVLWDVLVRQRGSARRNGLLLALLVIVQFFLSVELLASEVLISVIVTAIVALRYRDRVTQRLPYVARVAAWTLAPVALVCGWPLAVQLVGPGHVSGSIWPAQEFSADLLNLVVPTVLVHLAPASLQAIPFHIDATSQVWSTYVGVPVLLLVVFALVRLRGRFDAALFGSTFFASLVLSLGPSLQIGGHDTGLPLPMRLVQAIPGLANLQADRVALYAYLCAAVLIAMLVADLRQRPPRSVLPAIAVAATCASLVPTFRFPTQTATVPTFFTTASVQTIPAGSTALVLPLADSAHPSPMLWQAASHFAFAMTGGYAIRALPEGGVTTSPPQSALTQWISEIEATGIALPLDPVRRDTLKKALHQARISAVIVGPDTSGRALIAFVTDLLGRAPRWEGGVALWTLSVPR